MLLSPISWHLHSEAHDGYTVHAETPPRAFMAEHCAVIGPAHGTSFHLQLPDDSRPLVMTTMVYYSTLPVTTTVYNLIALPSAESPDSLNLQPACPRTEQDSPRPAKLHHSPAGSPRRVLALTLRLCLPRAIATLLRAPHCSLLGAPSCSSAPAMQPSPLLTRPAASARPPIVPSVAPCEPPIYLCTSLCTYYVPST